MRPVILIGSCWQHMYAGFHDAIRETWGKDPAIPFFFVLGSAVDQGVKPLFMSKDTMIMPVPDDRDHLAHKALAAQRWARREGYDFVFQAWNDTYCFTRRMLASGFEKYDYSGHFRGEDHLPQLGKAVLGCYASGGSGYWLSPYAGQALCDGGRPDHWADDLWVGKVMKAAGIRGTQDYRYFSGGGYDPCALTVHLSRGSNNYQPAWMEQTHRLAQTRGEL